MVLQMLKFNNLSESVELKWVQDTSLVDVQINILSTISRCLIFVPNISFALFFPTAEMATHYEKRNIFLFDSLRNSEDNSCQISYRLEYLKNDRFNLRVFAFSMSTYTPIWWCFFSSKNHFKWCTWSFFLFCCAQVRVQAHWLLRHSSILLSFRSHRIDIPLLFFLLFLFVPVFVCPPVRIISIYTISSFSLEIAFSAMGEQTFIL